jgi:hypothetical protein
MVYIKLRGLQWIASGTGTIRALAGVEAGPTVQGKQDAAESRPVALHSSAERAAYGISLFGSVFT